MQQLVDLFQLSKCKKNKRKLTAVNLRLFVMFLIQKVMLRNRQTSTFRVVRLKSQAFSLLL